MLNTTWIKNLKTPIAVIGLGKSGLAALRLLKGVGFTNSDLITYDDKDASAQINDSQRLLASRPKTIVVSPGVSLRTPWIQKLIADGAQLTSEISLAASFLTNEKVIGITGSVGKSTVTSLLGVGAKHIDANAFVGGNLGIPFCEYAIDLLNGKSKAAWIILELSSYQLENCRGLPLDFSAITFLSPNHLERYDNLEQYYQTKLIITELTKNTCVLNKTSDDAIKSARLAKCNTDAIHAKTFANKELLNQVALIGSHNKDNFSVAARVAELSGWHESTLLLMANYRGLPHRLEFVGQLNGVNYVNDSKATAMDSVAVATQGCLEALALDKRLFLLLGGKDKNLPWEQLSILSTFGRIRCVFFGACGKLAQEKSELAGPYFEKLEPALIYCEQESAGGDTVLLSPGGTSLDEFKNFEARGNFFKDFVNQKNVKH